MLSVYDVSLVQRIHTKIVLQIIIAPTHVLHAINKLCIQVYNPFHSAVFTVVDQYLFSNGSPPMISFNGLITDVMMSYA